MMLEQVVIEVPEVRPNRPLASWDCAVYLVQFKTEAMLEDVVRVNIRIDPKDLVTANVTMRHLTADRKNLWTERKLYEVVEIRIGKRQNRPVKRMSRLRRLILGRKDERP